MIQMTNREKLIKTNIYDLLCSIQDGICCIRESDGITGLCIIEDITKEPRACPSTGSFGKGCADCIAVWLDEETQP